MRGEPCGSWAARSPHALPRRRPFPPPPPPPPPPRAGLYLFAYSFVYFGTQLDVIGAVPTMVYFVYMAVASLYFFLVTGTAGFIAAYTFVWLIYGAVKVD